MHSTKLISCFASFSILGLVACANVADEAVDPQQETVETTASELRALQDNEKLGPISYGQSKTVTYTENPLYRAYSFSGTAGDSIEITVHSTTSTDAMAWLLAADYTTLASNDNANSSTKDSRIVFQIQTTGTYWIAVREANQEDATFTVTLNGNGSGTPDGIFDPNYCSGGTPFTLQQALRYFAPGANTSSTMVNLTSHKRRRSCNKVTGCGAWQTNNGAIVWTHDSTTTLDTASILAKVESDSSVQLYVQGSGSKQALRCGPADSDGTFPCIGNPSQGCDGSHGLKDSTAIVNALPELHASTTCFHAKMSGSTISSSSADYVETEAVLYGTTLSPTN
ncbi:PPC domain-containing protein [Pendulispora rubella]|uniref:PPC domain-containing protein n=1 Tax=Pendulispora rubella TaxID=2741070 RepID=A0ABZ2L9N3_9BACT